jgi:hypothetical protein
MPTLIETKLSVEQIAEAFADLYSNEQAEFFAHVQRIAVKRGWWPEQQWSYLCGHIDGEEWLSTVDADIRKDARESLMSMAAPLYLHTLRAIESPQ